MSPPTLTSAGQAVEAELENLIDGQSSAYAKLSDAMRYSALNGGKRLRAWLVAATGYLFDADPLSTLRAGAAIELIHAYSLIHDDLPAMDDADTRRGKPANHKAFDEATAILAGDALQALAFAVVAREDWPANDVQRLQLVRELAQASGLHGMCGGQMLDLMAENSTFNLDQISHLQSLKTGALFGFSVRAGGILGDASFEMMAALDRYAAAFGLAFQIRDDLLDLTGDAQAVGKDLGRDCERGKATFPSLLGTQGAQDRLAGLRQEATHALKPWGRKANHLKGMIDFVIERQS